MFQNKKVLGVIPARGGSKRIPHKNIVDFCGKPLIAWTIEAAKQCSFFDRLIVSTDDPAIAQVSRDNGADVPFLRDAYFDEFSPVSEATIRTVEQLHNDATEHYDIIVQLFAVCPLRDANDISSMISEFHEMRVDFLLSCYRFTWMNPWWAFTLDDKKSPVRLFENKIIRSQDLPPLFCPTGAVWIANWKALKEAGTFYGRDHRFYELDWKKSIDIDDYEDMKLARILKSYNGVY